MPPPYNMSNTPVRDSPTQEMSSSSGQMLPSQPAQPISEPSASKRVCFYKSGDYQFSGHRMIVTPRTFKTFDALLDALSKKVPLPFGVRTITTPRGTHFVKALEDLQDGGAYVCSDQKRVKPLNVEEVNRRQVPWNATRPLSAGRRKRQELSFRQFRKGTVASNRPAKVAGRVAVRTPKKLTVIKNRDPTVRRTIVLQRRTAPTFDALLDYLSQVLQFPVLKLYSRDGRRVDGLGALILCSGIIVAAGNEPFRFGKQRFYRTGQTAQIMYVEHVEPSTLQTRMQDKSLSSGRSSRNFSLSSERFIVNQINKSQSGSLNGYLHHPSRLSETEAQQHHAAMETCGPESGGNENSNYIIPHDDDIEKSFRVNQDGSMTVEMKVRLTIKEEEMLHWTTTLSRSGLSKKTVCGSLSGSDNSSPDSNNSVAKDSSGIQEDERKEENYHNGASKGVAFNDEHNYKGYSSTTLGRAKTRFKRTPTPGPQHVNEMASVESVKMVTEIGVQQSTLGHYSYTEKTADGETTEGYCVVRHSNSSNKPVPKPCRTASSGVSNKCSSIRSSGVAEDLQIKNGEMEVTETVMHIYESQGCYDNYVANKEFSTDGTSLHGSPPVAESKTSTASGPQSSNNDCDIDCNWQPPTADSIQRQKEEILSLSSEPESLTHQATNNLSSVTENEAVCSQMLETVSKDNAANSTKRKKIARPPWKEKGSASTNSSDKKHQESTIGSSKHSKHSSTDKLSSNASVGKKSLNSLEGSKSSLKNKGVEKSQSKKSFKEEQMPKRGSDLLLKPGNAMINPQQKKSQNRIATKDNGHNINTLTERPQMKKNMSDILQTKKTPSPSKKTMIRPKSMTECELSLPKPSLEVSESASLSFVNPSPSEIFQYVENWLEKVNPDSVPYAEEVITDGAESQAKVVFKIGDDSESDEINQCQTSLNDTMKKSPSCLSVPLCHDGLASGVEHGEQRARGLCVSMPSVRADPESNENKLRLHKSVEAICPNDSETSNLLSPKAKLKPVLRQVCSSIQCIRRASASSTAPTLHNSSSLPNFSTQVASVFGSSCKAFLSFLSVMTLRDNLNGSQLGEGNQSRTPSEAMLMMESLQKISGLEDEEEQKASLTDLQSRASSQLRERWKDFQTLRERLESEPLSPRVSETEFALDVVSEGGDTVEGQQMVLDELMEELNMPQDLREEIVSTIQQTKSFYPAEESTFVETVRNQSESEEDIERFVGECEEETKDSPEPRSTNWDLTETKEEHDNEVNQGSATEIHEIDNGHLVLLERGEAIKDEEHDAEKMVNLRNKEDVYADEEDDRKQLEKNGDIDNDVKAEMQRDSEEDTASDRESVKVEEVEEEMTGDEDITEDKGFVDEETRNDDSVEHTDEREGAEETEEEGNHQEGEAEESEVQDDDEVETIINEEEEEEEESKGFLPEYIDKGVEEETERNGEVIEIHEQENMENDKMSDAGICTLEGKVHKKGSEETEEDVEEKEEHEKEQVTDGVIDGNREEDMESEEEEASEYEEDKESEKDTDEVEYERSSLENTETDLQEEKADEVYVDELDNEQNTAGGQTIDEEDSNGGEESKSNQKFEQMEDLQRDDTEDDGSVSEDVDNVPDDQDCETMFEEASCQQQHSNAVETQSKYSSEDQCEDKCTDTIHETDEGGEEDKSNSLTHPVEISQELLDFVNDALQSYSLIFTYDTQGNVRIVPDNARVVQTKQSLIPKPRKDSSYGLKCLPSPITSDLSDYRPETSGSGGYKTQESVDIISESGEEPLEKANSTGRIISEQRFSKLSAASYSLKSGNSPSSSDDGTKASREDLSYFSAASSLKEETEAETQNAQNVPLTFDKDSADGVLIDRGRWLLKENHLIRKSPPVSLGMYGNLDSTSIDTNQENTSVDSPSHTKTQHSPLAAISSSELEEMAKPLTPKCTYYNMPHGSDSDPFLDDVSVRSRKHDASSIKARGFRVSPTVDTSKSFPNRNGSLSSFASVEFKIPDRKVHPEVESSAVTQPRRTSNGEQGALQAQGSLDSLHLRCGQYCPIL